MRHVPMVRVLGRIDGYGDVNAVMEVSKSNWSVFVEEWI